MNYTDHQRAIRHGSTASTVEEQGRGDRRREAGKPLLRIWQSAKVVWAAIATA